MILLMGKSRNLIFAILFYEVYSVDWYKKTHIFPNKVVFFILFDDFVTICFDKLDSPWGQGREAILHSC